MRNLKLRTGCFLILVTILTSLILASWACRSSEGHEEAYRTPPPPVRQIFLQTSVDQHKVPVNNLIWLIVRMGWAGEPEDIEVTTPVFSHLQDFKIMETSSWKFLGERQGPLVTTEYKFLLKPLSPGNNKEIPPLKIRYRETKAKTRVHSLSTSPLHVDVGAPEKKALSKLSLAGIAMGLFGLTFLIIFALTFIRKTYQKKEG